MTVGEWAWKFLEWKGASQEQAQEILMRAAPPASAVRRVYWDRSYENSVQTKKGWFSQVGRLEAKMDIELKKMGIVIKKELV